MSISFYGSSDFSVIILEKLYQLHKLDKIKLEYVVSQSSKELGRKKQLRDNPVVAFCKNNRIDVVSPEKIKELKDSEYFKIPIDLAIVASYGKILPGWLVNSARYGFVNIHGSLLPKYRGAAPVQFSVLNQDVENAGVTFIKMDKGMDTGKIILAVPWEGSQKSTSGSKNENFFQLTAGELMIKLANLSSAVIEENFDYIFNPNRWNLVEQDESKATYCYVSDMVKENFEVTYWDGVKRAHGKIMAANPEPKAFIRLQNGQNYNLLRSAPIEGNLCDKVGVLSLHKKNKAMYLELSDGFIEVLQIQPVGKKAMDASSFINGYMQDKNVLL